jgi:UDP-N-acetylmuramate dehydrogenase
MNGVIKQLEKIGCEFIRDYSMNYYTSMRVGGLTDLIVYPKNQSELTMVLNMLSSLDFPWTVLGGGSNTIIDDSGIRGVVISTKKMRDIKILRNGKVIAEAGAVLGSVLNKSIRAELSGFEFVAGIPGTVGGGIFMNAGANDGEIKDVVEKVWIWLNGKEFLLSTDELKFEYRRSFLPQGSVVTKALFSLTPGNIKESERRVKDYLDKRNKTQPITTSNSGSIFKNLPQIPAGMLLDQLGFKGYQIGRARFSELHANFIVNSGGASASDVLKLIDEAKQKALLKTGMLLETEVKIIGQEKS